MGHMVCRKVKGKEKAQNKFGVFESEWTNLQA